MVKASCEGEKFLELLMELVEDVWNECKGPTNCCDAVLVTIPKKGDLTMCDNWRRIAFLDVVGKVVARVLQERVQKVAGEELQSHSVALGREEAAPR